MTEQQVEEIQEDISELKPTEAESTVSTLSEEDGDGVIQISNSVLVSVVRKYVLGVEGVCRFQNQSLMDGMLDILSKRTDRSIVIEMPESGAEITVRVVMRFGVRIPDVAHEIQRILREKIEELTGYAVAKVNVMVSDLEDQDRVKEAKAAEEAKAGEATEAKEETDATEAVEAAVAEESAESAVTAEAVSEAPEEEK